MIRSLRFTTADIAIALGALGIALYAAVPAFAEGKGDREKEAIAAAQGKIEIAARLPAVGRVPELQAQAAAALRTAREDQANGHKDAGIADANHASELADMAVGEAHRVAADNGAMQARAASATVAAARMQTADADQRAAEASARADDANARAMVAQQQAASAEAAAAAARATPVTTSITTTETVPVVATTTAPAHVVHHAAMRRAVAHPAATATTTTVTTAPASTSTTVATGQ